MQRGSMSALETVAEFATDSGFAQTPNYVDSGAPPIKFALLLGLGIIIRCGRMANDTRSHPKSPAMMPGHVDPNGKYCKPYRAETSRAARIIPGNSALTTATAPKSSNPMTITILSPRLVPMTSLPLATNSLANQQTA